MRNAVCAVLLLVLVSIAAAQNPPNQPPDPYKPVLDRLQTITVMPVQDWKHHADVAHPEDVKLSDVDWPVLPFNKIYNDGPQVVRQTIEIPETLKGYSLRGAKVVLDFRVTSDEQMMISVFNNGALVFRGNEDQQEPIPLTENAQPGQKFVIAMRVGSAPGIGTRVYRSELRITPAAARPDPGLVRAEILAARPVIAAYPDSKAEHEQVVDAAVKAIDLAALDKGDQQAFDASMRAAHTKLQTLNPWLKGFYIRATGNSHIDMAWLWPWTETVEVVRDTFQSALDLMREYPDFTFTMSSARAYAWMEDKYPALFKQVQERVKEGRWEIVGGMWVEPDLNLPDGEALSRQVLIGKRYFKEKFGVDVKIGWNPDSFGYNWQLPQIYKRSGMDYFVTQKIYWNDTTKFPHKLFWWEAPDGSRLLTYFPHDYANSIDPPKMANDLAMYAPAMKSNEMMYLFGVGDHGGGPTRTMLDLATKFMDPNVVFPTVKFGTAMGFFDDLNKNLANLNVPTWKDELYFEYHRGVQTTQAQTKRRIRESEELLENAEKFASIASLFGNGGKEVAAVTGLGHKVCCEQWTGYPQAQLADAWKKVLFDEFHDIMPGSGIAVNYRDAQIDLTEARRNARGVEDTALREIAAHVNTQRTGLPAVPVVIFNPLSWPRIDVTEVETQMPPGAQSLGVVDPTGKAVQSQTVAVDASTHRAKLLLQASAPALGYTTYFVRQSPTPTTGGMPFYSEPAVTANDTTLENIFIRIKVDPKTGCMTSILDKRTNTEALGEAVQPKTPYDGPAYPGVCGNLLQAFVDKPKDWDAWNIDAEFEKQRWDLMQPDEVKLVESGPLRYVLRVRQHFQNSKFVQDITMYPGQARVDVHMSADWNEKHILLKVAFPLSAHSDHATYEIPFGSIERPTTRNNPRELAMFEVPARQWADLSDATHGFALLNDSKYGYDAKGNVLRLSLLRSPTWPDPHADEGHHEFTYSILPHAGGWKDAGVVRQAYQLNYSLIAFQTEAHAGPLPAEQSFFSVDAPNVVITAIKKAEDDDGIIVRWYEWAGKQTNVRLSLPRTAASVAATNLMEQPEESLTVNGNGTQVVVPTKPYEIKTVKVTFK
jgi:alpha-mannosidase